MQIDTTTLPTLDATDWQALLLAVQTEQGRRDTVVAYPARAKALEDAVTAALPSDPSQVAAYATGSVYQVGAAVSYQDAVYWWPGPGTLHDTTPGDAQHPFWALVPPPTAQTRPWTVGMSLTPGDLVTNGGEVWRYTGAAVTSAPANYAPTQANAAWADAGPAS